jgi:carboxymethylenebutenolidase
MRLTQAIMLAALAVMDGSAVSPAVHQQAGAPAYDTFFYKHDGLRLEAYLYRPSGPGPFPLVVYNHGSREDRTEQPYPFIGRLLADAGYAVLVPERRGYGKSEGRTFADEIGGSRGAPYIARLQAETGDALAAVDHVLGDRSSRLDPRRVAIMGFSAGGVVTVFGAARSDRFGAVVTQAAGARSWPRSPELREALPAEARRVRAPTLCMVAENDTTTESVRRVCEAVRANGAVADLIVYPPFTPSDGPRRSDPGHQLFNREGVSIWGKDVLAFLAKHVKSID